MGIFDRKGGIKGHQSAATIIARGCKINGQVHVEGDIQIDGFVEGQIKAEKNLLISSEGGAKGNIHAKHVVINGQFEGICYADQIEILSEGCVKGTIFSDNPTIEPGGKFYGNFRSVEQSNIEELGLVPEHEVVDLHDVEELKDAV